MCWIPWVSMVIGFCGLVTGIVGCALRKRGLGIAGIVISSISLVVAVVVLVVYLIMGVGAAFLNNADVQSTIDDILNSIK